MRRVADRCCQTAFILNEKPFILNALAPSRLLPDTFASTETSRIRAPERSRPLTGSGPALASLLTGGASRAHVTFVVSASLIDIQRRLFRDEGCSGPDDLEETDVEYTIRDDRHDG
jgi:hypothetical protein